MTEDPGIRQQAPEPAQQVAALCWRARPGLEMLLVTSLSTRRWILPKGWPVAHLSLAQSAAHEAEEEAGVTGAVSDTALGSYDYLKRRRDGSTLPCRVFVFALQVTGHLALFAEQGARELSWLPFQRAAEQVSEPGLRPILLDFHASLVRDRNAPHKQV